MQSAINFEPFRTTVMTERSATIELADLSLLFTVIIKHCHVVVRSILAIEIDSVAAQIVEQSFSAILMHL
jgi:hypothetical protein